MLGFAVDAGSNATDPHACVWTYSDPNDVLTTVSATMTTNINSATFADTCSPTSNAALGITVTPISGLGDAACAVTITGLGVTTTFQKGGNGYSTNVLAFGKLVSKFDAATDPAMEKTLAQDALARL